jgi:hypothetical protein
MKQKLPLKHPWRRDKVGSRHGNPAARKKALAEVMRRRKELCKA